MNEHTLPIVADRYRRLIPPKTLVDVAMCPIQLRVVGHHVGDVLPVSACWNLLVAFDDVVRMTGCDVVRDAPHGRALAHRFQVVADRLLGARMVLHFVLAAPVAYCRKIGDRLPNRNEWTIRSWSVCRSRERPPTAEILGA